MKKTGLRSILLQMNSNEDVARNVSQIEDLLRPVAPGAVDIICLPENSLYMRVGRKRPLQSLELHDRAFELLQKICERLNAAMMVGSLPLRESDGVTNATVFLKPNEKPAVVYRKIHLFDVDVAGQPPIRESETFRPGRDPSVVVWRNWRLGLSICYDLRFAELFSHYGEEQVDAILVPSAFLVPTGQAHWHVLLRARAIENQCYVLAAAQAGVHQNGVGDTRETFGHTLVVDPWGEILAEGSAHDAELISVVLDENRVEQVRQQMPQARHRRPHLRKKS